MDYKKLLLYTTNGISHIITNIKNYMSDELKHAPEEYIVAVTDPETGDESRYASLEDQAKKAELAKPVDYSKGIRVMDGEQEVTIFTQERDGKDYVAQAEAYAAEHGYQVSE